MNEYLSALYIRLKAVAVFRNILSDGVINALLSLLDSCINNNDKISAADNYGNFVHELYNNTDNLSEYIFGAVSDDENVFVKKKSHGEAVSEEMTDCVKAELSVFNELASLTSVAIKEAMGYDGFLPSWKTTEIDFEVEYFSRCDNISKYGYGIYAKYHMFRVKDGAVAPVKNPDTISLSDLSGYHDERQTIINNTKALLSGKPAANILLSGDAGTGKSSTVKAVVNELKGEGLRIVEVRKEQLVDIPSVIEELSSNPLKFILFIDDLSFSQADDNFNALKAILEGSVTAKSNNVVIYATSNRRHIVRESFADRDGGDDIHRNDTVQELMSLSERFGLCITFVKPDKKCYLEIAKNIASSYGIDAENEKFSLDAERFALKKGGRSARVARQFVDSLRAI